MLLAVGREAGELVRRVRAEDEVRRLNLEFEAGAAERTQALEAANRALLSEIDERRRAEEALRRSEQLYRRMFDHDPDALLVVDGETLRILDANEAAVRMYGFSREELLSLQHRPICRPSPRRLATRLGAVNDAEPSRVLLAPPPAPRRRGVPRRDHGDHRHVAGRTLVTLGRARRDREGTPRRLHVRRGRDPAAPAECRRHASPEELYELILPPLLDATRADRVYVFQNRVDEQGRLLADQVAELVRPGISAQIDNPRCRGSCTKRSGASGSSLCGVEPR